MLATGTPEQVARRRRDFTAQQRQQIFPFERLHGGPPNLLVFQDAVLAAKYSANWKAHLQHAEAYARKGIKK